MIFVKHDVKMICKSICLLILTQLLCLLWLIQGKQVAVQPPNLFGGIDSTQTIYDEREDKPGLHMDLDLKSSVFRFNLFVQNICNSCETEPVSEGGGGRGW